VAGETNFDSSTGTIMFWMRTSGLANPGGNPATLFDRLNKNGCILVQNADGSLLFEAQSGGVVAAVANTAAMVADNHWHHVAIVFDQSPTGPLSGLLAFYIDGAPDDVTTIGSSWSWQPGQEIELGLSHDTNAWQAFNGSMDDVRYYNRGLLAPEIILAEGGALVDTNALVMQLDFATAPSSGLTLTWHCTDTVLQSADQVNGPYSDLPGAASPYNVSAQKTAKFYRYRGHAPVVVNSNPYLM
jgi:hypothetical protein